MHSARPNKKTIPSFRPATCPECGKPRLLKEIKEDGTVDPVSDEQVEVRDEKRYTEVCNFCIQKYQRADQRFVMANLKKIQKAMSTSRDDLKGTDHKDFSLDI